MSVNGMNVGVDYSISYYDGNQGSLVDLGDVQDVKITAQQHLLKTLPYNDDPRYGFVPDGFKIDFTITRSKSTLEDLMVTFADNFAAGNALKPGYLNESVNNTDGTISRYQYTNLVVYLTDHGTVSRDKTVTQKLEAYASRKRFIA